MTQDTGTRRLGEPWPRPTTERIRSLRTFTYRTWGGSDATVTCETVTFEATHVVFRDGDGSIVLAEDSRSVGRLTEHVIDEGTAARRRLPIGDDE